MSFAELCYEMIFIDQLVFTQTHTHTYICKTLHLHSHTNIHAFYIDQSIQPTGRKERKKMRKKKQRC